MIARTFVALLLLVSAALAAPPLSTVQDVLYKADGTRFNGALTIAWSSFQASDQSVIVPQTTTVQVVDGNLRVQLVPTTTSSPAAFYSVTYNSDGRTTLKETWAVPSSATPLRVRDVRVAAAAGANTGGAAGPDTAPVQESDVVGLIADLGARPVRGPGYGAGRVAVVNATGALESVNGAATDCVHVDGSTGPCGAPPSFVDADTLTGIVDGANTQFTLSGFPDPPTSLVVYRNGLLLKLGQDYTFDGGSVAFTSVAVPQPGDTLLASYRLLADDSSAPADGPGTVTEAKITGTTGHIATSGICDITSQGTCTLDVGSAVVLGAAALLTPNALPYVTTTPGALGQFTPGGDVAFSNPKFTVTHFNGGAPPASGAIWKSNPALQPVATTGADIVGLFTGACDGSHALFGDGACKTPGGQSTLDSILAAGGPNTIGNGDSAQAWNWRLTSSGKSAFTFGESSASTAAGIPLLLNVQTLAGSTANPLQVTAGGTANGVRLDTTGKLSKIGSGQVNADRYNGNALVAVADGGTGSAAFTAHGVLTGNGANAINATAIGAAGQVLTSNGAGDPTFQGILHVIGVAIHGGGSVISTGDTRTYPSVNFACTINKVTVTADQSGSLTVEIWKTNAAIPTSAGKISASAPATLSTAQFNPNSPLTGWTTSVAANDVFGFNVTAVAGITKAAVQIWCQ